MKSLTFLRHPPLQNMTHIAYGALDVPVADKVVAAYGEKITNLGFERIITSPLVRAQALATMLAAQWQVPLQVDDRLREISLGTWEGRRFADIATEEGDAYRARGLHPWAAKPPQGESFAEVGERAFVAWQALCQDPATHEESMLIVGHSGWLRALAVVLKALDESRLFAIKVPYGTLIALPVHERDVSEWPWWFEGLDENYTQ